MKTPTSKDAHDAAKYLALKTTAFAKENKASTAAAIITTAWALQNNFGPVFNLAVISLTALTAYTVANKHQSAAAGARARGTQTPEPATTERASSPALFPDLGKDLADAAQATEKRAPTPGK